ncbi:MAG: SHOCT domain-containing protein [Thermodesulfobacteriota bacterium]
MILKSNVSDFAELNPTYQVTGFASEIGRKPSMLPRKERPMGPEYYWMHGMWIFPVLMPIVMLTVFLLVIYLIFGRGGIRPPWQDRGHYSEDRPSAESALDILKKRYAKGEITKEEFEQMKKDVLA